jgi:hypothetical protein
VLTCFEQLFRGFLSPAARPRRADCTARTDAVGACVLATDTLVPVVPIRQPARV